MEMIKKVLSKFDNEYIEDYKNSWVKAKFKSKNDLLKIVEELKNIGVETCSTVSPTDFIDEDKIEVNYFIEDIINNIMVSRLKEAIKERVVRDIIIKTTNNSEMMICFKDIDKSRSIFNVFKMF